MKERPILFSAPMVRAIIDGQKTQTRRMVKLNGHDGVQSDHTPWRLASGPRYWQEKPCWSWQHTSTISRVINESCPYGVPGDRLWVRESAYIAPPDFGDVDTWNTVDNEGRRRLVGYAASMDGESVRCAEDYAVKKTPSIYMPRWASRITLEITSVRCERLQEIDDHDAMREGVSPTGDTDGAYVAPFKELWEKINGAGSWENNPWVWVVSFKRVAHGA